MDIKKLWVDATQWSIALKKNNLVFSTTDQKTLIKADVVSWNPRTNMLHFKVGDTVYKAHVQKSYDKKRGDKLVVYVYQLQHEVTLWLSPPKSDTHHANSFTPQILSPLAGRIIKIAVKSGEKVQKGDTLCIIEAMKMENEITAPSKAIIKNIPIAENDLVESDQVMFILQKIPEI